MTTGAALVLKMGQTESQPVFGWYAIYSEFGLTGHRRSYDALFVRDNVTAGQKYVEKNFCPQSLGY